MEVDGEVETVLGGGEHFSFVELVLVECLHRDLRIFIEDKHFELIASVDDGYQNNNKRDDSSHRGFEFLCPLEGQLDVLCVNIGERNSSEQEIL